MRLAHLDVAFSVCQTLLALFVVIHRGDLLVLRSGIVGLQLYYDLRESICHHWMLFFFGHDKIIS